MRRGANGRSGIRGWMLLAAGGLAVGVFAAVHACASTTVECGNGSLEPGEECDDGNASNDDACTALCKLSVCGDGITSRLLEECDDTNLAAGDGCSPICTREGAMCGNGSLEVSGTYPEECDDGNTRDGDGCSARCFVELSVCGDGVRQTDEQCDDGNREPGDGCNANCRLESADGGDVDAGDVDGRDGDVPDGGEDGEAGEAGEVGDADALDARDGWECRDPVCDLVPQCGCEAGRKCTLVGGVRACGSAGFLGEGRACTADLECSEALMCSGAPASETSLCYRFCADDGDCAGGGSKCVIGVSTGGEPIPGVTLCSINCDPSNFGSCAEGLGCKIWNEGGEFFTDCGGPVGTGRVGHNCTTDGDCAPGYFCNPGFPTCLQYCQYPGGYCDGGYTCTEFDPAVRIGTQNIGYCG